MSLDQGPQPTPRQHTTECISKHEVFSIIKSLVVHYDKKILALEKSHSDLLAKQTEFINTIDQHQQELERQQRFKAKV
jgi:hypothetical protein